MEFRGRRRSCLGLLLLGCLFFQGGLVLHAQENSGYFTDPETGFVYRQVKQIIQQPKIETKVEKRETTVYRPKRVQQSYTETRTVYEPITNMYWQPYVEGRWNLFRQPVVAYRQVAQTQWIPRNQSIPRTSIQTNWVPEKSTIDVPHQVVKMEPKEFTHYELIGRVSPSGANSSPANSMIASRLKPLASDAKVQPIPQGRGDVFAASSPTLSSVPRIALANSNRGDLARIVPERSSSQSGMQATDLAPQNDAYYALPLSPSGNATGIARLPVFNLWR